VSRKSKNKKATGDIPLIRRASRMNNGDEYIARWIVECWSAFGPQADSVEGQHFLENCATLARQVTLARQMIRRTRRASRGNRSRRSRAVA